MSDIIRIIIQITVLGTFIYIITMIVRSIIERFWDVVVLGVLWLALISLQCWCAGLW